MWSKIQKAILKFAAKIQVYRCPCFIMFCKTSYCVDGDKTRKIIETIKPGDILMRKYDHYITSKLTPGYWSHAAIYAGDNKVIHMMGNGVIEEDILTFCRCDDIEVIRCKDKLDAMRAVKASKAILANDIDYDYSFNFEDASKMSCTEMVNNVYGGLDINLLLNKFITPDDIAKVAHTTKFDVVLKGRD